MFGDHDDKYRDHRDHTDQRHHHGDRLDLFSMKLSDGYPLKRKVAGKTAPWENGEAVVRVPMVPMSYLDRESRLAQLVPVVLVPTSSKEET